MYAVFCNGQQITDAMSYEEATEFATLINADGMKIDGLIAADIEVSLAKS